MSEITEQIIVNGETKTIQVKPISIICHDGSMNIQYPERIMISDLDTFYHMDRVQKLHEDFGLYWKLMSDDYVKGYRSNPFCKVDPDVIRNQGSGFKHLGGLLDLSLKFTQMGVRYGWMHPESHLHPSLQVEFAQLVIWLTKTDNLIRISEQSDSALATLLTSDCEQDRMIAAYYNKKLNKGDSHG
jgi:hypothetical protein